MADTKCAPIVIDSDDEDLDVIVLKEEKVVSSDDEDAVIFISQTLGTKKLKEEPSSDAASEKPLESDTLSCMSSAVDIGLSRSLSLTSDFSYNLSLQIGSDDISNVVASSGGQTDSAGTALLPAQESRLFGENSTATNNDNGTSSNNQDLSIKVCDLKTLADLACASQESSFSGRKNDDMPIAFQGHSSKSLPLMPSSCGSTAVVPDTKTDEQRNASSSGKGGKSDENFWSYLEGVKDKCKLSNSKLNYEQDKPETSKHLPEQSYCHPKKKLKYSEEFKELFNPSVVCINCSKTVSDKNVSRCSQNHATCTVCLNDMVLLILTGKSQEKNLTCPKEDCSWYFSSVEMRRCLPPVVVQVLEENLEQDYVNFIDRIMQQEGETLGDEGARGSKGGSDLPKDWYPMEPTDSFMLVRLQPETEEHLQVTTNFYGTAIYPYVDIINIYRVQNPILWKYYCVKKDEMVRENDGHSVPEKDLFHGTPLPSIVEAICRKGFDWRLCGKHGTAFGEGCYFAVKASYSHRYTGPTNTGGLRSSLMFLQSQLKLGSRGSLSGLSFSSSLTTLPSFGFGNQARALSLGNPTSTLSGMPISNPFHFQSTSQGAGLLSKVQVDPLNLSTNVCNKSTAGTSDQTPDLDSESNEIKIITPAMFKNGQDPFVPGSRKMFQARILVGRFTGGHSSFRKPPPLHPQLEPFGTCYDSCVDDIYAPNIYVVFDSAQTYPDYVIEYQFQMPK